MTHFGCVVMISAVVRGQDDAQSIAIVLAREYGVDSSLQERRTEPTGEFTLLFARGVVVGKLARGQTGGGAERSQPAIVQDEALGGGKEACEPALPRISLAAA